MITLYNDDCLNILRTMPDESVDCIVSDPPYALTDSKLPQDRIKEIASFFSDIHFPKFDQFDFQSLKYSDLCSILCRCSDLGGEKALSIGINPWISMPKGSIDFYDSIITRQIEITGSNETPSFLISDGPLMEKQDAKFGQFIGDFIFDFRNTPDFSFGNIFSTDFGKFSSGFFTMPIGSISAPFFPDFKPDFTLPFDRDGILDNIRFIDDSWGNSGTSRSILAKWTAKNGFMLRFQMGSTSGELLPAESTFTNDLSTNFISPKLIRTRAGASCLSTMFKPLVVRFIQDATNGALPFYFHLWVPPKFINKIINFSTKNKGFMGKEWDGDLPSIDIMRECLRVLKAGAFSFWLMTPRQDMLSRFIVNLQDAGFVTKYTSLYWCYHEGFPKAMAIDKAIDKRLGMEREVVGISSITGNREGNKYNLNGGHHVYRKENTNYITAPASEEAKRFAGSFGGFQPKPSLEVVVVVSKPLSEKTFVDQALANGKGITWLGDGKIPTDEDLNYGDTPKSNIGFKLSKGNEKRPVYDGFGRFPANILVQDDALNDGVMRKSVKLNNDNGSNTTDKIYSKYNKRSLISHNDSGSASRYYDLDRWYEERLKELPPRIRDLLPIIMTPKPDKDEKNQGVEREEVYRLNDNISDEMVKKIKYHLTLNQGDAIL